MNENEMKQTGLELIEKSKVLSITNDKEYANAAEDCKDIKLKIFVIEKYWEPLKTNAFKAHKDICAKEKELLTPYTTAEAYIKSKMITFQRKKLEEEKLLKEEQEAFRKAAEERLLDAAVEAEKAGKTEQSDYCLEQAEVAKNIQFEEPTPVKVQGSAVVKTWKARVIDESIVPIIANGTCIRPIDESCLNKMATMVKGKSNIQGVEFYEDINIAVKRW